MTKQQQRKEDNLIKTLEEYATSLEEVYDVVYDLIDKKCWKTDVSFVMSKHKEKLKRLEIKLKTF